MKKYEDLVIVIESPNKIRKFRSLLPGASVYATAGHFMDLPEKEFGVDFDTYEPTFVADPSKRRSISEISKAAEGRTVVVATDADREGYAIGKFLYDRVRGKAKEVLRAEIREITKKGIEQGLDAAVPFSETNLRYFEAWKGRRVGDRLIGYILSPLANEEIGSRQDRHSVGRVQSVAVRLLVDREREIRGFVKRPYWEPVLEGSVAGSGVRAKYLCDERIFDRAEADRIVSDVSGRLAAGEPAAAVSVERAEAKRKPPPPFTTSTLQQSASSQLGLSVEETMRLAQKLFEGGYITYHRSDSTELSAEFVEEVREFLEASPRFAPYYDRPKTYKPKGKKAENVQGAHEAIRPTGVRRQKAVAEEIAKEIGREGLLLYELIFRRAVASQMKPAVYDTVSAVFAVGDGPERFEARGRVMRFPGFLFLYNRNGDEGEKVEEEPLPDIGEGDVMDPASVVLEEKETKPPSRYTEAGLVKRLEKDGIGRPSTYASILSTIKRNGYVEEVKKSLAATPKAERLVDWLAQRYGWLIQTDMTALMEEYLDKIAEGEGEYVDFCRALHAKMGNLRPASYADAPPTPKQLEFAKRMAEEMGIPLADEVVSSRAAVSKFIEKAKKSRPPKLTERQKSVIEKNAPEEIRMLVDSQIPEDVRRCREWLDRFLGQKTKKKKRRRREEGRYSPSVLC